MRKVHLWAVGIQCSEKLADGCTHTCLLKGMSLEWQKSLLWTLCYDEFSLARLLQRLWPSTTGVISICFSQDSFASSTPGQLYDFLFYFLLVFSRFTMLCYFLLYSKLNQLYMYIILSSLPEHWIEFPVLYRRLLLVIYFIPSSVHIYGAYLVAQRLKRLPPMRETRIWSLGQEDPLEKEMATHSSILAWRIPWTEEPGGLQSMGSQKSRTRMKWLSMHVGRHLQLKADL